MTQNKFNLVTEYWYRHPVTYDKNKYAYEIVDNKKGDFRLFDKRTNTTIFYSTYITMVEQISENEFVVLHNESPKLDNNYIFEHIYYNEQTGKTEKRFFKEYKSKSIIARVRNIKETYILDSYYETTIYNTKTRELLTLEHLEIDDDTYIDNDGNQYLIGETTITTDEVFPTYEDVITMYINTSTLKFNGFCSRIQGERFILIFQNEENTFIENYNNTVEEEVLKYLILLEEQEEYLREQSSKKARNILMKMTQNNTETQKLKNAMDFYLLANNLKYKKMFNQYQSIANHIYGAMILAIAINSEYDIIEDLGTLLRIILLEELQINFKEEFDVCLSNFNKGLESEILNSNAKRAVYICKLLDNNLNYFFEDFIICNNMQTADYKELFTLAKENGFFSILGNDELKNLEIFRFYYLNNKLKNKIRSGWDSNHWNVKGDKIETISEHVVGTVALAIALKSEFGFDIDLDKVISTLCVHEVGEIKIGDITPFDGVTIEQKQAMEHKAIIEVIGNLSNRDNIINSIFEFDKRETNDAKFTYYCDKLEADIQAKVYQDMGCHHPLTEQENNIVFKSPKVQKMIENGATTAFDIWYEWDKSIYTNSQPFTKVLKYIKNTKLK